MRKIARLFVQAWNLLYFSETLLNCKKVWFYLRLAEEPKRRKNLTAFTPFQPSARFRPTVVWKVGQGLLATAIRREQQKVPNRHGVSSPVRSMWPVPGILVRGQAGLETETVCGSIKSDSYHSYVVDPVIGGCRHGSVARLFFSKSASFSQKEATFTATFPSTKKNWLQKSHF